MDNFLIDTAGIQITQSDFIIRLLISIGIGFLIGLEREHAAISGNKISFAGIRTIIFVSILGFMASVLAFLFSYYIYLGVFLSVVTFVAIAYWQTASKGDLGATTEFSVLITFILGGLSFLGMLEVSIMITVIVVVLLSSKLRLQHLIGNISSEELVDFIRFVVVALLIFPFLPDENMGPFNVINPQEVGWVVILTSGLGFIGYVLRRILGAGRGILLTGIVGGLVSSTAVTWIFAKKSKSNPSLSGHCAIAILSASTVMIIRVFVWTYIFNRPLFASLLMPISLIFIVAGTVTLIYYYQNRKKEIIDAEIRQDKPLDLQGALFFGFIYVAVLLVVSYANAYLDEKGILISSTVAGLSDINAITISMSKLGGGSIALGIATLAVLLATLSNTVAKMIIALWAGSKELRKYLYWGYGSVFVTGILCVIYLFYKI